jgi:Ser/Thr protein kinase RdoA (MazF antagonist)
VEGLAALHDRFWNLGTDLQAFSWLSRPLSADFEVHVTAAAHAIEQIVYQGEPEGLAAFPERMQILAAMTTRAEEIAVPLRRQPMTLLHGDYWPGNISVTNENGQVVYDWQLTAIGPAILDLVVFVKKSEWWFDDPPLPAAEIIGLYQGALEARLGFTWEASEWERLWDHAVLWRFLQEWVDLLAASPDPVFTTRVQQLEGVWLKPVMAAARRILGA